MEFEAGSACADSCTRLEFRLGRTEQGIASSSTLLLDEWIDTSSGTREWTGETRTSNESDPTVNLLRVESMDGSWTVSVDAFVLDS